jgi:molybdate-binding protein
MGPIPYDGVFDGNTCAENVEIPDTIVIACCDPAVGILCRILQEKTGLRVLPLYRSSGQSLELLQQGKVHIAGLHFAGKNDSKSNADYVNSTIGEGYNLLHYCYWVSGVAVRQEIQINNSEELLSKKLRWLGRAEGTGARLCQDLILQGKLSPEFICKDHISMATAISQGLADAGICQSFAAAQHELNLFSVREESFDFCYPKSQESNRAIVAIKNLLSSRSFIKLMETQTGYDGGTCGEPV